MGSKDHLPTIEETTKKRNRNIKKLTSIQYIGNPPVFTREVDQIGIVSRTTSEVRDTDFPVLANIEDLTDNIQTTIIATTKTIQIELGKQEAQFHRLFLDDDGGTITDFIINMVGLAKNKALEFIADIETSFSAARNITFNPPLSGLPTAFGDAGSNKFKFLISAIDTPIETSYEILNAGTGGGGVTGYDTIQDEGSSLIQQNIINFIGTGVIAVNNPGQNRTDVTITSVDTLGDLTDVSVGGAVSGQSLIFNGSLWTSANVLLSNIIIDADKSWNDKNISDILSLGSSAAFLPGSGFIRMAFADELRMRNSGNDDDLIIKASLPTLDSVTQDAISFIVSAGVQMYIGEFDISVEQNDIINTGNILPSGTGGEVGDSTNFYNQMHSQFFVPEPATVILGRYSLAKTGNTLYVNFDNTNIDAGFSIYEQGFESFRFYHPSTTVNEFHIGSSSVFTAGEEYAIQMGEGSANARIFFIEGAGNDLILNRSAAGVDQGVQISGSGLPIARFLSDSIKIFQPLDANAQDLINVVDIKSNGGGGVTTGTIGELINIDGGFNYFMRDTLSWESDANKKLTFGINGITLETNGNDDDIDILAQGANSNIDIRANTTGFLSLGRTGVNHLQFGSNVTTFSSANIVLATGTQEIQFIDAISGASATTPVTGDINLFNDVTTGELSVKKPGGSIVSLEGGGTVAGVQDSALWTNHETTQFDFEVWHSNNLNGAEFTNEFLTAGNTVYVPIRVGESVDIIEIGLQVIVTESATVNLAIYDSYPGQNYPRTRLATTSTSLLTLGTGLRNVSIGTIALVPGLYWLAVHSNADLVLGHWLKTDARSVGFIPDEITGDIKNIRGYRTNSVVPSTADDEMTVLTANNTIAIFARFE